MVTGEIGFAAATAKATTRPSGAASNAPVAARLLVARPFWQRRCAMKAGSIANRHTTRPHAHSRG
jgi:hypothetical protein